MTNYLVITQSRNGAMSIPQVVEAHSRQQAADLYRAQHNVKVGCHIWAAPFGSFDVYPVEPIAASPTKLGPGVPNNEELLK